MKLLFISFQILLFCQISVWGQTDISFEKIKLDAQTDISIVSSITQDNYGYIWAATEEGVLRYDGHRAFLYNEYTGLPKSFSNKIGIVYLDAENNLWASSDNQLARLDRDNNVFQRIKISDKISIINDMCIVGQSLYLGTFNGLWQIPMGKLESGEKLVLNHNINHLTPIDDLIFVGSRSGLYKIHPEGDAKPINLDLNVTSLIPNDNDLLAGTFEGKLLSISEDGTIKREILDVDAPIYGILHDKLKNEYYIGTDGDGIRILSDDMMEIYHGLQDVNKENSLSSNGVYDIHADNSGQIWIATYGGGINKFRKGGNPFSDVSHIANESQSIANSFTRAILETQEGEIWYGTKEGISIYDPVSDKWKHIPSMSQSSKSDIIMDLAEDDGNIWVATYGSGLHKINKKSLRSEEYSSDPKADVNTKLDRVYAVFKAKDGKIYAGGINGPVVVIDKKEVSTLDLTQIRDIEQGPDGKMVFVGRSGVNLLVDGQLQNQTKVFYQDTEFDYSTINCVTFGDDKTLWIGTNGDGIIKYDIVSKEFEVFNISTGLPSDIIQGIILKEDHLWASTSRGLVRFDKTEENPKIEVYNQGDGMKNTSFNYGSYCQFRDGRLAFGSTEGVVILDPSKLNQSDKPPQLILENIHVLNTAEDNESNMHPLSPFKTQEIKLHYQQDFVKVDFTGIDHVYPNKVQYSWQMKGINDQWSTPSPESNVTFAGLNPGKYTLNVKAINRHGLTGEVKSVKIHITPPWWKSTWAYILYTIMAIGAIWLGVHLAKALLARRNADEQISFYNNIIHELKTPLSILLTKLENTTKESGNIGEIKTTVKRMNGLFDQLLNFNKVSSAYYRDQKVSKISFAKHVNLVVDTFRQEMEKKDLSFTFNNNWPNVYFYYKRDALDKITFNLISNAIKYSENGGSIIMTTENQRGKLKMTVKDNGIGIPKDQQANILKRYYRARNAVNSQTPGTGLGLMIVKNLVEYDGGEIAFTSEEGLGSAFSVLLPSLINKYEESPDKEDVKKLVIQEESAKQSGLQSRILVVEDNDELRIDLVEKLSEHFSIVAARNGVEGLEKAKQKLPDLILTDLIMPEMDGNQLCEELQKNEDTNHIPVFMMTVLNSSTQKVESIKSGVTSYMTKPIDFPFLVAKINSVLEYKQKLREKYLHETEIDQAHKFKDDRETEFVKKMEDFIIEKIKEESISVQDLCKHMGMSRTALYMKLKDMIDMSLQNFIITTRMNQAKKLLLQGGVTVKEVAFQVGFNNPKYFSTSFKKQFGESPSGFLKSLNPT